VHRRLIAVTMSRLPDERVFARLQAYSIHSAPENRPRLSLHRFLISVSVPTNDLSSPLDVLP